MVWALVPNLVLELVEASAEVVAMEVREGLAMMVLAAASTAQQKNQWIWVVAAVEARVELVAEPSGWT
jgi:hypothetical protein